MFFSEKCCFLRKKSPRQGCTKPKTELGMHQNPHFQWIPLKINESPKINPPSTITIPESAFGGGVLKGKPIFIEFHAGLRGKRTH